MNNFSLSKGSFAIQHLHEILFYDFFTHAVDLSRYAARISPCSKTDLSENPIIIRANSGDFFMAPVGWSNSALLLSKDQLSTPSPLFLRHFYNGPKKGSPFSPRIENNAESSAAGEIRRGPASTPRVWYIDDTSVGVADLEED